MIGQMLVCAVTNGSDDVLVRMCKVMATPRGWGVARGAPFF